MSRRRIAAAFAAAAIVPVFFLSDCALAQDVGAGRKKAVACQSCHGIDGIAKLPDAPNLAAQPAAYLERELRAYRSGARRNEVMSIAAKSLSDGDIQDLAAYYAAIQIEVRTLPP